MTKICGRKGGKSQCGVIWWRLERLETVGTRVNEPKWRHLLARTLTPLPQTCWSTSPGKNGYLRADEARGWVEHAMWFAVQAVGRPKLHGRGALNSLACARRTAIVRRALIWARGKELDVTPGQLRGSKGGGLLLSANISDLGEASHGDGLQVKIVQMQKFFKRAQLGRAPLAGGALGLRSVFLTARGTGRCCEFLTAVPHIFAHQPRAAPGHPIPTHTAAT